MKQDTRLLIALYATPVMVPVATFVYFERGTLTEGADGVPSWVGIATLFAAMFAYGGMFIIGTPTYFFLVRHRWTSIWIAPFAGFLAGTATFLAFLIFLGLVLDTGSQAIISVLGASLVEAMRIGGSVGIAVATIFWLIARPDLGDKDGVN
jgi:hypothetical protein